MQHYCCNQVEMSLVVQSRNVPSGRINRRFYDVRKKAPLFPANFAMPVLPTSPCQSCLEDVNDWKCPSWWCRSMAGQGGDLRYRSPELPCGFGHSAACGGAAKSRRLASICAASRATPSTRDLLRASQPRRSDRSRCSSRTSVTANARTAGSIRLFETRPRALCRIAAGPSD